MNEVAALIFMSSIMVIGIVTCIFGGRIVDAIFNKIEKKKDEQ